MTPETGIREKLGVLREIINIKDLNGKGSGRGERADTGCARGGVDAVIEVAGITEVWQIVVWQDLAERFVLRRYEKGSGGTCGYNALYTILS